MLIDTHCHLDFKDFDGDRDEVIERAGKAGVAKIINVGSSVEGSRRALELAGIYDMVYATLGVHPHEAKTVTDKVINDFRSLAKDKKVVAIGEVGLDYFRNLSPRDEQVAAFRKFIALALDLDRPMIFHSREAKDDILAILKEERGTGIRGVMHCFSEDADFLKECLDLGLFVSFTCNITFKNAEALRKVARLVPVERLLLETDAPFLAPQEFRGSRNEPAYLALLVEQWSKLLNLSKEDVARITTHNANSLFALGLDEKARIAYQIRDSLYLNITNRCTNRCDFCIRDRTAFVKGHNLKLEKEPSVDDILKAVGDPGKYREVVFCGYGESTVRLDVVKTAARELKKKGALAIRIVTNGHGDLINSRPIAKELFGLVDSVSVSLNVDTEQNYTRICRPEFGQAAYARILDFIKACVANNIETEVTCLDLPGVDVGKCEEAARNLGASFRMRSYGVVG
ncbi:MAG: YchF/TatD family DNA exonuclease [Candidatus Omnitrophota bacterium]|nr:YchF/TatD family DNA exonuclease [Candidatus Omnitrophota bacterium]